MGYQHDQGGVNELGGDTGRVATTCALPSTATASSASIAGEEETKDF